MSFSVNTNIASLRAQDSLRVNSEFQQKTIARVTSGLRIVSSGDDAAGLAIANSFRSDLAVLSQGVRNANDGLSTLQTIDGGLNNISKLLDRARTLATQSASGTFTGTRSVLNSEFQSVLEEVDRQAQAIGLNTGGDFAKTLSVFIGGGRGANSAAALANGAASVDLSRSSVDAQSLGLKGVQAQGAVTNGLQASSTQSVQNILADTNNTTATAGFSDFYFYGSGFAGADRIKVSVNTSGVTDSATLASAINSAVSSAGNGTTAAATAFKNANIKAAVVTDSTGKQQISFTSSNSAFQVQAGDRLANALLGNTTSSTGTAGKVVQNSLQSAVSATTTAFAASTRVQVRITGGGLGSAVDINLDTSSLTVAAVADNLSSAVANNSALRAAGITLDNYGTYTAGTTQLTFRNARGESFQVQAAGDTGNRLGLGNSRLDTASGTNFDYTSVTSGTTFVSGAQTLNFSFGGGANVALSVGAAGGTTAALAATAINDAIAQSSSASQFQAAGIRATVSAGAVVIESTNGTNFRLQAAGATDNLGFGAGGTFDAGPAAAAASDVASIESAGAYQAQASGSTGTFFSFNRISTGNADQTVTVTAVDPNGGRVARAITLRQDSTTGANNSGRSVDEAVTAINNSLQQSNDATLQRIVAVKDNQGGTEGIRFLSTVKSFEVSIGSAAGAGTVQGITTDGTAQSVTVGSAQVGSGANSDITTVDGAKAAVSALADAVRLLGDAQAVVGKGQNQFNYAINLAQTQISNIAAAESRIRDADLAAEAANLTKAQILQQAGVAALAQANSAPQAILSLLRG